MLNMLTMSIHKMGSFEIVISTLIGLFGGDGHCQPGVSKIIPIKMKVNNGAHGLRKHQKLHLHFDGWFDWWQAVQNFTDRLKKKKTILCADVQLHWQFWYFNAACLLVKIQWNDKRTFPPTTFIYCGYQLLCINWQYQSIFEGTSGRAHFCLEFWWILEGIKLFMKCYEDRHWEYF